MLVEAACYEAGHRLAATDLTMAQALGQHRAPPGFLWLSLVDPSEAEMRALRDGLGLHELAAADILSAHERPKFDVYPGGRYLMVLRTAYLGRGDEVRFGELAVFLGSSFVVSFRKGGAHAMGTARAELEGRPDLLANGVSAVLWAILDKVLRDIRPVVDGLDEKLIGVEGDVFGDGGEELTRRIYRLRQELAQLYRAVHPMLDLIATIQHGGQTQLEPMRPYFRDASDAAKLLHEDIVNERYRLTSALEADIALIGQRQNEQVRKISGWAAIITVPTLVAGIWGMNFQDMPGLSWRLGFPVCLAVMVALALALYRLLRRARWM